jgi:hypothetical protein
MPSRNARRFALANACCALLVATGCGGGERDGTGVPVSGKVSIEGEPLTTGSILYIPDPKKGNNSRVRPAGPIDGKGVYTLSAEGKRGIPPGWYTVVVQAYEPVPKDGKGGRSLRVRGRALVNSVYGRPETSGLQIEVSENPAPGAYDLNLRR